MSESKSKSKMSDNLFQLSLAFNYYAVVQLLGYTLSAYPTARVGATFMFGLILLGAGVIGLDNWANLYHRKGGIYDKLQNFVGFLPFFVAAIIAVFALLVGIHIDKSGYSVNSSYQYEQQYQEDMRGKDVVYR